MPWDPLDSLCSRTYTNVCKQRQQHRVPKPQKWTNHSDRHALMESKRSEQKTSNNGFMRPFAPRRGSRSRQPNPNNNTSSNTKIKHNNTTVVMVVIIKVLDWGLGPVPESNQLSCRWHRSQSAPLDSFKQDRAMQLSFMFFEEDRSRYNTCNI